MEKAFNKDERGGFGVNEIKMLRLIYSTDLKVVKRVKVDEGMISKIVGFARMLN